MGRLRPGDRALADLPAQEEKGRQALLSSLAMHAARAFADPRSEIAKDRWDLTVLGHHGWLAFTGISNDNCFSLTSTSGFTR